MRTRLLLHSRILSIVCALLVQVSADARETFPRPEKFKISLEVDKPKFFLGELVLLHYCVENTGTEPFRVNSGGDYRGHGRPQRWRVAGKDKNGVALLDPLRNFHPAIGGGLSSSQDVKPGGKWWNSIDLHKFIEINEPGTYTISVSHDLGWELAERINQTASVEIEVVNPTPEEAVRQVEQTLSKERNYGTVGERDAPDFDATTLRYPIYLPLLKEHASADTKEGERARKALECIETPDATSALLAAAKDARTKVQLDLIKILNERLPDPRATNPVGPDALYMKWGDGERQKLRSVASWRPEMVPEILNIVRSLLADENWEERTDPVYTLYCLGTKEDGPLLMKLLDRVLEFSCKEFIETNGASKTNYISHRIGDALIELTKRGVAAPKEPQTHAECALYLLLLAKEKDAANRPTGWDAYCVKWIEHPAPKIRAMAVGLLPKPLPADLRDRVAALAEDRYEEPAYSALWRIREEKIVSGKEAALNALSDKKSDSLRERAYETAIAMGWRYEALEQLAQEIGPQHSHRRVLGILIKGITGKNVEWSEELRKADRVGLKKRWLEFLHVNRDEIQAGHLFSPREEGLDPQLFYCCSFKLADGTKWPNRE